MGQMEWNGRDAWDGMHGMKACDRMHWMECMGE